MLGGKAIIATIIDIRFYWGWLLFYFLFKNITISLKFTTIGLVILCIITIFETLLINTFVAPTSLPNFPDAEAGIAGMGEVIKDLIHLELARRRVQLNCSFGCFD